jgi:hypothetical protein
MKKLAIILFVLLNNLTIYSNNSELNDSVQYDTTSIETEIISIDSTSTLKTNREIVQKPFLSEWEKGFISGLFATLIGFLLTIIWDIYKYRRDNKEKENNINNLINNTISENFEYIELIEYALTQEMEVLDERKNVVASLPTLRDDFGDFLKYNMPKNHAKNEKFMENFQKMLVKTRYINQNIIGRETFKLNNEGMLYFERRLKIYNESILKEISEIKSLYIDFKKDYFKK